MIEPFYLKAGDGRPPYLLEIMEGIHLLKNWFAFSDPAMEEALYEVTTLRQYGASPLRLKWRSGSNLDAFDCVEKLVKSR